MDSDRRPLSLPVRVGAVLIASLLVLPLLVGLLTASSGAVRGGVIAVLGFVVFFGGIVAALFFVRRRADAERAHDRQWGPRPRPPM